MIKSQTHDFLFIIFVCRLRHGNWSILNISCFQHQRGIVFTAMFALCYFGQRRSSTINI